MSDNNRGLYSKYEVKRTDGSSKRGRKHEDCRYFVLDLEHDVFAVPALQAYARACREKYPALAADLDKLAGTPSAPMTPSDLQRAREAWEAFEAGCAGLLASQCKYHRPYMGCPLDCNDVENAIGDEWKALRPLVPALLAEVERLRGERDEVLLHTAVTSRKVTRTVDSNYMAWLREFAAKGGSDAATAFHQRIAELESERDSLRAELEAVRRDRDELKEHMDKHFPARGSRLGDLTTSDEIVDDLAELSGPVEKLKLDLSDPHTQAVWDAVLAAKRETSTWPAWKSGAATALRDARADIKLVECERDDLGRQVDRLRSLLREALGIALTNMDPEWPETKRLAALRKEEFGE